MASCNAEGSTFSQEIYGAMLRGKDFLQFVFLVFSNQDIPYATIQLSGRYLLSDDTGTVIFDHDNFSLTI